MALSHRLHGQIRRARSTCLRGLIWALFAAGCGERTPRYLPHIRR
jgi:hypothetical protein